MVKGMQPRPAPGAGTYGSGYGSGAGYGGAGGAGYYGNPGGEPYGYTNKPIMLGSGGGPHSRVASVAAGFTWI